jgi:tetratricopeptide (TPR) repeat protein
MFTGRTAVVALAGLSLAGCASRRGGHHRVDFEPTVLEASAAEEQELAGKNAEELFALGTAAYGTNEHRRAALAFSRLADGFADSPRRPAALYNAGLAFQRLEEWRLALERFQALAHEQPGADGHDAVFRMAECYYHLKESDEAHRALDGLLAQPDLPTATRIRALSAKGIVELEEGRPTDAERTLREAVRVYHLVQDRERLEDYHPGQAQFYLGEVFRAYFQAVKLDPTRAREPDLQRDLEYKAELLLSAQGHYLRAIRIGNADWAIAAGYRIGELYDELYRHLVEAPTPSNLDANQAQLYRSELRGKIRVLLTKAIAIYERTLATAERVGVSDNKFLAQTQASLERMKQILLAEGGGVPPPDAVTLPPDAEPGEG